MALKWNDSNRAYLTILLLFLGYYYRNFYIALLIDVVICFIVSAPNKCENEEEQNTEQECSARLNSSNSNSKNKY